MKFRVFPNALEREKRVLFLPLLRPYISCFSKLKIIDENGKQVPFKKKGLKIPYENAELYLRYYELSEIAQEFQFEGNNIVLPAVDLKDWKYDFSFQKKDTILCEKKDENVYQISVVPNKRLKQDYDDIKKSEHILLEELAAIFSQHEDESFFHFAKLAKDIELQKSLFLPSPFHLLIANSKSFRIIQSNTGTTLQYLKQSESNKDLEEISTMHDLLKKLKCAYSESYVKAKMMTALKESNEVDVDEILQFLFPNDGSPFVGNEEQLFSSLFEELMYEQMQIFYRKKHSDLHFKLLNKAVKSKENAVEALQKSGVVSFFLLESDTELYKTFSQLNASLDTVLELGLDADAKKEKLENAIVLIQSIDKNVHHLDVNLP